MRYTRNLDGLGRLKTLKSFYPGINCRYASEEITPKEESEDTKIRRDIYATIINMINENKGSIEIEVFLRNKYPAYSEYIPKIVNDQFKKHKLKNDVKNTSKENGEER